MISSETQQPLPMLRRDLSKARLQSAAPEEQALFLVVAHVTNEINALLRAAVWSSDFSSPIQAIVDGQFTLTLMFLKLLAGKLNEAHRVVQTAYFGSALAKTYHHRLQPDAQKALSEIMSYFSGQNNVHRIRNSFAFHYSPDDLNQIFPSISEELVIYMRQRGDPTTTLFYFAEVVAAQALFRAVGLPNSLSSINDLASELIGLAGNFAKLFGDLMGAFLESLENDVWQTQIQPVALDQLPMFDDIHIPWFTDTSKVMPSEA